VAEAACAPSYRVEVKQPLIAACAPSYRAATYRRMTWKVFAVVSDLRYVKDLLDLRTGHLENLCASKSTDPEGLRVLRPIQVVSIRFGLNIKNTNYK
jgi:hypothetical protein